MSAEQNIIWLTYGPITDIAAQYYQTTDYWIGNFLAALGGIMYIPCMFISSWLTSRFGLRRTIQFGGLLLAAAGTLRLLGTISWVLVGQTVNAALGPIVMASPPRLSVEYFPPQERNTATALGFSVQALGVCVAFLWGPNAVHAEEDVPAFVLTQAAMAASTGLLVALTMPSPPERAPSASAAVERPGLLAGMRILMARPPFVALTLVWGTTLGLFVGWFALLPQLIGEYFSPAEIGWIGFASNLAGLVGGIAVGLLADGLQNCVPPGWPLHKVLVVALFSLTALCDVAFLLCVYVFGHSFWWVTLAASMMGFFLNATSPLVLEMAAEYTYPVSEETSAGVLTLMLNSVMLGLTLVGTSISTTVLTVTMLVAIVGGMFVASSIPHQSHRADAETDKGLPASGAKEDPEHGDTQDMLFAKDRTEAR